MATPYVSAAGLADWWDSLLISPNDRSGLDLLRAEFGAVETFHSDRPLELSRFIASLETVACRNPQAGFAWTVGRSAKHATSGKVGRAILGSKTLGTGLRRLCDFVPLLQDASQLKLEVEEDWSSLSYKILDPNLWPRQAEALYSLGIYATLINSTASDAWSQIEIAIEAEQDRTNANLSNIVNADVDYGGQANVIRFPTRLLNLPMNLAVPAEVSLRSELYRELSTKRHSMSMSDRVRHLIYSVISEAGVSQDDIAGEIGVSSRTMRRKLAADGTSYQKLLDECRMHTAALEFRIRKRQSLPEMAMRLGYSEHSNFSRAFVRWTGIAPQDYRRELTADCAPFETRTRMEFGSEVDETLFQD